MNSNLSGPPPARTQSIQPNGTTMTEHRQKRGLRRATGGCRVNYCFCTLDDDGRVVIQEERTCSGDVAALVYARSLAPYQTIEIWDGAFRVAHIEKGEDPLQVSEGTSGVGFEFFRQTCRRIMLQGARGKALAQQPGYVR